MIELNNNGKILIYTTLGIAIIIFVLIYFFGGFNKKKTEPWQKGLLALGIAVIWAAIFLPIAFTMFTKSSSSSPSPTEKFMTNNEAIIVLSEIATYYSNIAEGNINITFTTTNTLDTTNIAQSLKTALQNSCTKIKDAIAIERNGIAANDNNYGNGKIKLDVYMRDRTTYYKTQLINLLDTCNTTS